MNHIASLSDREQQLYSHVLAEQATDSESPGNLDHFQSHQKTREVLDESRDRFARQIGRLHERLATLARDGQPDQENERERLLQDIQASEQCLEVCKVAQGEVNRQKIHTFGKVVADGDSDQVVVTTLADLFNVNTAISKGNSAQLIGSTTEAALIQLSKDRYASRFGALDRTQDDMATSPAQRKEPRPTHQIPVPGSPLQAGSNETRKRTTGRAEK